MLFISGFLSFEISTSYNIYISIFSSSREDIHLAAAQAGLNCNIVPTISAAAAAAAAAANATTAAASVTIHEIKY